ncbi:MAG: hypothetical protein ACREVK_11275 [Gammaproteobacteria bacterium]
MYQYIYSVIPAWSRPSLYERGRARLALCTALAAALALHGASATARLAKSAPDKPVTKQLSIGYGEDRINARIVNTSLGEVCRELAQKTAVRCALNSGVGTRLVSATINGLPLRKGIEKILAGFSYAIYPAAETGKLIVKVLATPEKPGSKTPPTALGAGNAAFPPAPIAPMPPSLEESQPAEIQFDREAHYPSEWEAQGKEQAYRERLL